MQWLAVVGLNIVDAAFLNCLALATKVTKVALGSLKDARKLLYTWLYAATSSINCRSKKATFEHCREDTRSSVFRRPAGYDCSMNLAATKQTADDPLIRCRSRFRQTEPPPSNSPQQGSSDFATEPSVNPFECPAARFAPPRLDRHAHLWRVPTSRCRIKLAPRPANRAVAARRLRHDRQDTHPSVVGFPA